MALGEEIQEALGRQRHAAAALEVAAALEREDAARRHAAARQRDDVVDRGAGRHQRAAHAEQQEGHRRAHPHLAEPLAAHVGEIDVERHRGLAAVVPLLRQDRLDPRHQREGVALGEVERADQPGPEPLRALPLDAIAVVAAHGHELLAQESIDGATHRLDRRLDDAADDDAARAQRAGERPLLFRLDRRAPPHLGQRLLDRRRAGDPPPRRGAPARRCSAIRRWNDRATPATGCQSRPRGAEQSRPPRARACPTRRSIIAARRGLCGADRRRSRPRSALARKRHAAETRAA